MGAIGTSKVDLAISDGERDNSTVRIDLEKWRANNGVLIMRHPLLSDRQMGKSR